MASKISSAINGACFFVSGSMYAYKSSIKSLKQSLVLLCKLSTAILAANLL